MYRIGAKGVVWLVLFGLVSARGDEPAEPLLAKLPPGVVVQSTTVVPPAQLATFSGRLGGRVERLTNSFLRVRGRPIQVNVITAVDDASARAILARISALKPPGFCLPKGRAIVEYVGRDVDDALADVTSRALGLVNRPTRVVYRVVAELATIDRADDQACNPLFNHLLTLERGPNPDVERQADAIIKAFAFGRTLRLRSPSQNAVRTVYRFAPEPTSRDDQGAVTAYTFANLPTRRGIPYVVATMEITLNDDGFHLDRQTPAPTLTAATPRWPVDDPTVVALARSITVGRTTNEAKVDALLKWLAPGTNLKYSGQTGSRYGVPKVLAQKFGHCWDFADVFVTLARASGVPCREVAGWLHGSSGHVWAEYYREGRGWQQVDPTGGGQLACGIEHIPFFTTDDGFMPILYLSLPKIEWRPPDLARP